MSYRKLEIWQISRELVIEIHSMTMKLPNFESIETGRQIRRSIKSTKSNIVEGYGRRKYIKDYIRFIIYALSSNDETIDHLETLFETQSLKNKKLYENLHDRLNLLGIKLNHFLRVLEKRNSK